MNLIIMFTLILMSLIYMFNSLPKYLIIYVLSLEMLMFFISMIFFLIDSIFFKELILILLSLLILSSLMMINLLIFFSKKKGISVFKNNFL